MHRRVLPRDEAVRFFTDLGEHYKAEIIAAFRRRRTSASTGRATGSTLCRGPHVPSTGQAASLQADQNRRAPIGAAIRATRCCRRIYGTAWADKKQLDEYLHRLEEAEKRDHRRIGRELDLFHLQEEAPGAVFWHPKGWLVFQTLIGYMRERQRAAGYEEVNAPELMDASLWRQSGHLEKFGENMYLTRDAR